ncbi:MAG: helix-turn-helix transcriptional regulator [Bacteroidales bacterium]|nr:helix-turn-helix transcriptional regulator [Bacteroidales bacterium]
MKDTKFDNISSDSIAVADINKDTIDSYISSAFIMNGVLVGICLQGSTTLNVNGGTLLINKGELFGVAPQQVISMQTCSEDYHAISLYIPTEMIPYFRYEINVDYIHGLPTNRSFSLTPEVIQDIMAVMEILKRHTRHDGFGNMVLPGIHQTIAVSLIETMILLANDSTSKVVPQLDSLSRQAVLTKRFFSNLLQHYKENHTVEYYAGLEDITPKYLSSVVRQVTGRPVQEWINFILIYSAKRILRHTDMSVGELSDYLHFASATTFIRFFRIHTGKTPSHYKRGK